MSDLLENRGVVWREQDESGHYTDPVPEIDRSIKGGYTNRAHYGSHYQTVDKEGRVVWTENPSNPQRGFVRYKDKQSVQGKTRGFNYRDTSLGITSPVKAYPDRPIKGLHCPDCYCQAVETDQVGVALCSGTPGWYFYYRQRTNGIGQPEPTMQIVNGELKEVLKDKDIVIERVPDGSFREVKPDGELGKEVPKERVKK